MPNIDVDTLKKLVDLMADNDLTELQYKNGDMEIELKRGGALAPMAAPPVSTPVTTPTASPAVDEHAGLLPITSPMVGTFYAAPDPDSPAFVTAGASVSKDTPVCIIEAMKVFNEIKAEVEGVIEKIMVRNAEAVEYGQVLFYVRPT